MQSVGNTTPAEPARAPLHGFRLLAEPEPWLRTFLRNLGDLFRPNTPQVWMTSTPGEYWADALVHRPVAWKRMIQSYVGHMVVVACVYGGNLLWLNQPHVIIEEPPQNTTMLRYPLSEYLPEVRPETKPSDVPSRPLAQKADPAQAPQRIIALNVDHSSTQQTIIQPDLKLLQQDVALPNIVAWTAVPGAPIATLHHPLELPSAAPEVAPPAQPAVERAVNRLTFPALPQPQVIAPPSPVATNMPALQLAVPGPIVIPPAEQAAPRELSRLQIPAQAPPVAGPASPAVARSNFAVLTPAAAAPEVVGPSQGAAPRNLAALGLPEPAPGPAVAPPSPAVAGGLGRAQTQDAGRLLALNVHPLPPNGPVSVPEGNRKGEFAAGPEGRARASGAPETRAGTPSPADHSGAGSGPSGVFVDTPPVRTAGNTAVSAPGLPPPVALSAGAGSSAAADRIDNEIFGSRRRYSMRLNMPNLNSAMGSWTVRFAELNADPAERGNLTAPEAIRKVDPAYPANLIRDQVEGVVVLHAIIRSDGSVGDVRVLEGFYQELDENARTALEQWRFRPGTKNGVPVDVEAVIRVPFRASRLGF